MKYIRSLALAGTALASVTAGHAFAEEVAAPPPASGTAASDSSGRDDIIVTGSRAEQTFAGTKTQTPLIETPQPLSVVTSDVFEDQGAITISDTVRYTAGVVTGTYGRDTRTDGFIIRGVSALQFRDGMRDIFSSYASITSDPYNFSRVEVVRGPASVLFGQGSIGGLVNLVSKKPYFETGGEVAATYGSHDRKEARADLNTPLSDSLAVRLVGKVRDSGTHIDHVPDDRVMLAPSIRWQLSPDTDITLTGLYQEDDSGSTSQFLPIVGTLLPNGDNPRLDDDTFVGKPGWDRYDGRLLQGGGSLTHRISDNIQLSVKARYIDSDVDYRSHYTNSYTHPLDPYVAGSNGRLIQLYAVNSPARLNVFSTDNNLQFNFNTGAAVEHTLLTGVDYSWNKVRNKSASTIDIIDIYDIDRDAISAPDAPGDWSTTSQKQLGFYVQDQIKFWDRVNTVFGFRRDKVINSDGTKDFASTFRAGIIGEVGAGISPFFSYTESFNPVSGTTFDGSRFKPQRGTQYEAGFKWQPEDNTLVTITGFHIKESNRPISDPLHPNERIQAGELTTKGIEFEASHRLPGNFDLLVNYGYNKVKVDDASSFNYMPRHSASVWSTKSVTVNDDLAFKFGGGVRYVGKKDSVSPVWTMTTDDVTLVDAMAEMTWQDWRLTINATNLLDKNYLSCLARGDCFVSEPRNVMATIGYKF
ncbi:TonB-dependent siderophore receptor [Altericroceibacterium spongiae]|uniref:TonB-dependent siderophore receptor n=1 Tax=Altericroceibacterium spongiae TaxID=2320269 RepID=A0A420ESB2_9SPHN|nr:TonB-dependent siderophore receptor [Altericroceibacterium spongiae]RKF23520.1 TonB-dependent siderophore receptor [Altericroceibacterium spongiae]